jgi:hypothetical protein
MGIAGFGAMELTMLHFSVKSMWMVPSIPDRIPFAFVL